MMTPQNPHLPAALCAAAITMTAAITAMTPRTPLEMRLAAECLRLRALLIEAETRNASLEERNRSLLRALHRTACAG